MKEARRQGGESTVRTVLDALNALSDAAALSRDEYADERAAVQVGAVVSDYGGMTLVHLARQKSQLKPQCRRAIRWLARRG